MHTLMRAQLTHFFKFVNRMNNVAKLIHVLFFYNGSIIMDSIWLFQVSHYYHLYQCPLLMSLWGQLRFRSPEVSTWRGAAPWRALPTTLSHNARHTFTCDLLSEQGGPAVPLLLAAQATRLSPRPAFHYHPGIRLSPRQCTASWSNQ